MIGTIAARELRSLFLSPLAWVILAVVQFILAILFFGQLREYLDQLPHLSMREHPLGPTEYLIAPLFADATIVLLLVIPLLTMRLVSEERRATTLPLLFSAPVSITEIILGKYLGIMAFLGIMLGVVTLMPLSLAFVGTLDYGTFASAFLGMLLMLSAFAAAGLYLSTLTTQPILAALGTFALLLFLFILDWVVRADGGSAQSLAWLSLQRHYQPMLRGMFDTTDVVYYLLFITTFVVFSIRRLDADRLQH